MIPFNKPYLTGKEVHYIYDAVSTGKISGNGKYTKMCQTFFEERFGFKKCLLTSSCTDALEMAAILCEISSGDEVIMPAYTFVSTALAFIRQGAVIRFVDSKIDSPNMDLTKMEELINDKTKAIVVVHYAGIANDMDTIMFMAKKHNLLVVEDAAQAIDSFYTGKDGIKKALGSIGHFGCFSFHETKNIQCGEGGLLAINDSEFFKRSEIIWEKGTNRAEFFRGEVNKYGWVDTGSSFLPSEITAAFLWSQLEELDVIQHRRKEIWHIYHTKLKGNPHIQLHHTPNYATNNAHMFYLVCASFEERTNLINTLKNNGVYAAFHYQSLHASDYYQPKHDGRILPHADVYTDCLVRLPLYFELENEQIYAICDIINTL